MFMDKVKIFCDHSMTMWEMTDILLTKRSFWPPPPHPLDLSSKSQKSTVLIVSQQGPFTYRGSPTYTLFTTAIFGLCTCKCGIFVLLGDLELKRILHNTFFSSPKIRIRQVPSVMWIFDFLSHPRALTNFTEEYPKIGFSPKGLEIFSEILYLSSPNLRQKYL